MYASEVINTQRYNVLKTFATSAHMLPKNTFLSEEEQYFSPPDPIQKEHPAKKELLFRHIILTLNEKKIQQLKIEWRCLLFFHQDEAYS